MQAKAPRSDWFPPSIERRNPAYGNTPYASPIDQWLGMNMRDGVNSVGVRITSPALHPAAHQDVVFEAARRDEPDLLPAPPEQRVEHGGTRVKSNIESGGKLVSV